MSNLLVKTSESEVKQDKNGRNYKTVAFTEVVMMKTPWGDTLKPASQSRTRNKNLWENSYLDEKPEIGYHDSIFNDKKPANGGLFQGSIEERDVNGYNIVDSRTGEEREVNKYTTVVFGDSDNASFKSLVISLFKSEGHEVIAEAPKMVIQSPVETEEKAF